MLERLRDPTVRIVTLTGPGGVGKTRVALQVAAEVGDDFADGVSFVPLATVSGADLVASAVAQALGLRSAGGHSAVELLHEFLKPREHLLLLDSFEHVIDAAPLLSALVATCPGLKLVVTSRETLNLSAEHELSVPPLSAPDPHPSIDREEAAAYPAVVLFSQRARAANSGFALTDSNAPAVARICARLNGLPLALELAAARARLLGPEAILSRLERGLDLLTRGPRDVPVRQRTMRSTIQWSYDLLDETEQRVFRLMCVFVGGCTLEAVAAVCDAAGGPPVDALDTVASLLDKSMLYRIEETGALPRLGMLDTIREYGLEALVSAGDLQTGRRAHAAHYLAFGEEGADKLSGPDQVMWLHRLEIEHGNLRAALRCALDEEDPATAVRLAGALGRFWYLRGHLREGAGWLAEVLDHSAAWDDPARVKALYWACILGYHPGDYARARAMGELGLELARRLGDEHGAALSLEALALVARASGRYDESRAMYDECIATFRRLGDQRQLAESLARLGVLLGFQEEYAEAHAATGEAVRIMHELGDIEGVTFASVAHAFTLDDEAAQALYEDSLTQMRAIGTWRYTTRALSNLGLIAARRGAYGPARAQLEEAAAISLESGEPMYAAVCVLGLARAMLGDHRPVHAARLVGAATATRDALGGAVPSSVEADADAVVAAARKALGEEGFNVAFAEGQAMTLEQALASLPPEHASSQPAHPERLTARELEVLGLVAQGSSDAEVAETLVVSRRTVHAHLRSIYRKLDVRSRSAATRYALDHGLA